MSAVQQKNLKKYCAAATEASRESAAAPPGGCGGGRAVWQANSWVAHRCWSAIRRQSSKRGGGSAATAGAEKQDAAPGPAHLLGRLQSVQGCLSEAVALPCVAGAGSRDVCATRVLDCSAALQSNPKP